MSVSVPVRGKDGLGYISLGCIVDFVVDCIVDCTVDYVSTRVRSGVYGWRVVWF